MTAPATSGSADETAVPGYDIGEPVVTYGTVWVRRATREADGRAVLIESARAGARRIEWTQSALRRRVRILGAVDHPRLPRPLEVLRDGDRITLVFSDHGGHRLDEVLVRARRFPLEATLALGIELCAALGALHRTAEVHGLLRPAMVELTEQGQLYLHGAGQLPRGAERGRDELLELPRFMAPEMILGDEPDEASDVFLLGLLLYTCLCGHHPFDGDETGISQRIRHADAPRFDKTLQVPTEVERVILRCLGKRAHDRYLDPTALQTALVRALRRRTAEPREVLLSKALARAGLAEEPPKVRQRHLVADAITQAAWLPWAAGGLLVLILAGLVVGVRGCDGDTVATPEDPRGIVREPARLKILAHPWAEIFVDGERIDVTPIGRPVEVAPGRHVVAFRHPNAAEVTRTVEVIAGQTVLLDVQMQIVRPEGQPDAEAAPEGEDASP